MFHRIERLAQDIAEDIGSEPIYALCVLKGGYKFFTDLIDQVKKYNHYATRNTIRIAVDFVRIKSYKVINFQAIFYAVVIVLFWLIVVL